MAKKSGSSKKIGSSLSNAQRRANIDAAKERVRTSGTYGGTLGGSTSGGGSVKGYQPPETVIVYDPAAEKLGQKSTAVVNLSSGEIAGTNLVMQDAKKSIEAGRMATIKQREERPGRTEAMKPETPAQQAIILRQAGQLRQSPAYSELRERRLSEAVAQVDRPTTTTAYIAGGKFSITGTVTPTPKRAKYTPSEPQHTYDYRAVQYNKPNYTQTAQYAPAPDWNIPEPEYPSKIDVGTSFYGDAINKPTAAIKREFSNKPWWDIGAKSGFISEYGLALEVERKWYAPAVIYWGTMSRTAYETSPLGLGYSLVTKGIDTTISDYNPLNLVKAIKEDRLLKSTTESGRTAELLGLGSGAVLGGTVTKKMVTSPIKKVSLKVYERAFWEIQNDKLPKGAPWQLQKEPPTTKIYARKDIMHPDIEQARSWFSEKPGKVKGLTPLDTTGKPLKGVVQTQLNKPKLSRAKIPDAMPKDATLKQQKYLPEKLIESTRWAETNKARIVRRSTQWYTTTEDITLTKKSEFVGTHFGKLKKGRASVEYQLKETFPTQEPRPVKKVFQDTLKGYTPLEKPIYDFEYTPTASKRLSVWQSRRARLSLEQVKPSPRAITEPPTSLFDTRSYPTWVRYEYSLFPPKVTEEQRRETMTGSIYAPITRNEPIIDPVTIAAVRRRPITEEEEDGILSPRIRLTDDTFTQNRPRQSQKDDVISIITPKIDQPTPPAPGWFDGGSVPTTPKPKPGDKLGFLPPKQDRKRERKQGIPLYNVYIKQGKDYALEARGLPFNRARNRGADIVDNTPSVNFKLKKEGYGQLADDKEFRYKHKFTAHDSQYTERKKYRLDTRGERAQLPLVNLLRKYKL